MVLEGMSKQINVCFGLRDRVRIAEIDVIGFVDQVQASLECGMQYRVVYWLESRRYETWMFEHELEDANG